MGATFLGFQAYEFTSFVHEGLTHPDEPLRLVVLHADRLPRRARHRRRIWLGTLLAIDMKRGLQPKDALCGRHRRAVLALRRRRLDRDLHARLPDQVAESTMAHDQADAGHGDRPRCATVTRASDLEAVPVGRAHPDASSRSLEVWAYYIPAFVASPLFVPLAADHVGGEVRHRGHVLHAPEVRSQALPRAVHRPADHRDDDAHRPALPAGAGPGAEMRA